MHTGHHVPFSPLPGECQNHSMALQKLHLQQSGRQCVVPNQFSDQTFTAFFKLERRKKCRKNITSGIGAQMQILWPIQCQTRNLNRIYSLIKEFSVPLSTSLSHQKLNTEYTSSFTRQYKTKCNF